ncbi:MAG: hypothetical protein M1829_006179 [Trizodia sp. TS-e1964]|nr:MAG: hypothetical protein M1829_006179 [Trizodia sp. TS-e1964]
MPSNTPFPAHTTSLEPQTPEPPNTRLPKTLRSNVYAVPRGSAASNLQRKLKWRITDMLDRFMPHRKYCGLRRKTLLFIIGIGTLAALILITGLAVGLSKNAEDLPLPNNSKSFVGQLTYYGTGLGSCGVTSSDSDPICAVSRLIFDAVSKGTNPNANPLCGLKIRAKRFNEKAGAERSIDLTVVDRCEYFSFPYLTGLPKVLSSKSILAGVGCQATDLDLTPWAFEQLADKDLGRVDVTWAWLQPAPTEIS